MPGEDIYSWSTTAASNGSADTSINWQEGQARASVNNSARAMMAAHAKGRDYQNGSIVTTGSDNAQAFTSGVSYTSIPTGMRVLLKIGFTNTGATTLNMDSIGAVVVKDQFGEDIVGGALVGNAYAEFRYDGTNWVLLWTAIPPQILAPPRGHIDGLTLAYVTTTSFSVASGQAADSTNAVYINLPSAITKTLSAWAVGTGNGGLDTGAIAVSTWYHVYLIGRSDTGVVDVLLSSNSTTPTMPTDYDQKRRIGSIKTNASSQIVLFYACGDEFLWSPPLAETAGIPVSTTPNLLALNWVPSGVYVQAMFGGLFSSANVGTQFVIWSPMIGSGVTAGSNGCVVEVASLGTGLSMYGPVKTNNGAIYLVCNTSGSLWLTTFGYIDSRGRDL